MRQAGGFGGKTQGLVTLSRAGFRIPETYALQSEIIDAWLRATLSEHEFERVRGFLQGHATFDSVSKTLKAMREKIVSATLPQEFHRSCDHVVQSLRGNREQKSQELIVRSSSLSEDRIDQSAAGMFESFLHLKNNEEVAMAVKKCVASLFSERAMMYLRKEQKGRASLPVSDIKSAVGWRPPWLRMGVLVQELINADVSGVAFTANPVSGDPNEVLINACTGLSHRLMDGRVTPDTYRIEKKSGWVRDQVTVSASGVIPEEMLTLLINDLLRLEDKTEAPQDVEFAIKDDQLFFLQARPITTLPLRKKKPKKTSKQVRANWMNQTVWSNANVGEALPGVATPLTWSVLSEFSDKGFKNVFASIGCAVPTDAVFVASFRGRIYLNLSELMFVASQIPGMSPKMLLALGGGGAGVELEAQMQTRSSRTFIKNLPATMTRLLAQNINLYRDVNRFLTRYQVELERFISLDLRIVSGVALSRLLVEVERMLEETGVMLLSVYGRLLGVLFLYEKIQQLEQPGSQSRMYQMLSQLSHVESATPGLDLEHMAHEYFNSGGVKARFMLMSQNPLEAWEDPVLRERFKTFFETHGHRGIREAELQEPRWKEDPKFIFQSFATHLEALANKSTRSLSGHAQATTQTPAQEQHASKWWTQPTSSWVLADVKRLVRLREEMRDKVVRTLGLFRMIALESSKRMQAMDPECGNDGAFFLHVDELKANLKDELKGVTALIQMRRRQFSLELSLPSPPDTFVGKPPLQSQETHGSRDLWRGLPACGGKVRGRAMVLNSPEDASLVQPGDVLVTYATDVGWTPLFLIASAVVTDIGGPLSHAAVVAREYGLPTVVNTKVCTKEIRTGDTIEVDGDAGTIHRV